MDNKSCIYFILAKKTNLVKIGTTTNMKNRFSTLSTGSPYELELLYTFPGYKQKEKELHKKFEHLRVKGEWFNYTDEIKVFIGALELVYAKNEEDTEIKKMNIKNNKRIKHYNKNINVRICDELHKYLRLVSEAKDCKIGYAVREALEQYVKRELGI